MMNFCCEPGFSANNDVGFICADKGIKLGLFLPN